MIETNENYIKLTLDNSVLEKYNTYYFLEHPRAKKKPIPKPRHEYTSSYSNECIKTKMERFCGLVDEIRKIRE